MTRRGGWDQLWELAEETDEQLEEAEEAVGQTEGALECHWEGWAERDGEGDVWAAAAAALSEMRSDIVIVRLCGGGDISLGLVTEGGRLSGMLVYGGRALTPFC